VLGLPPTKRAGPPPAPILCANRGGRPANPRTKHNRAIERAQAGLKKNITQAERFTLQREIDMHADALEALDGGTMPAKTREELADDARFLAEQAAKAQRRAVAGVDALFA
jgi:hypothetical protein